MKKLLLITIATLTFAGCASVERYRESLDQMAGFSEQTIIDTVGVPTSSYTSGDRKYLVYKKYADNTETEVACETTFELYKDALTKSTFKGEDCTK